MPISSPRPAATRTPSPDNWDDLIALGADIDALGEDTDGIYYHFWGSDWMWQAAVGSFGGELMDDAEEEVLFDDERGPPGGCPAGAVSRGGRHAGL